MGGRGGERGARDHAEGAEEREAVGEGEAPHARPSQAPIWGWIAFITR
jgi:hypothetical protein